MELNKIITVADTESYELFSFEDNILMVGCSYTAYEFARVSSLIAGLQ